MAEYIEREKTVELLRSLGNREYRKEKGTIQEAIKMISYPEYTPTADVAPVVYGRWEQVKEWATKAKYRCSVCGREIMSAVKVNIEKYPYCHCGAKMDGAG